ncbi:protein O-mannosyl-transferase TMTC2-like isoform X5 [Frankliniella occidentalis]|uniref:dolichyl-phosphate-mannose--protein mannosyltransferase n=1 Tax=Frankliniella occidentalis TaxID=133901 RepID=A0A9C6WNY6_FRAOC|nr:protein O-mannosyl-transferase TMTC2-like isoform X1 [Frankliniella occidentalis]XP_052122969.1 protein O-mannosyl-transferase TMTC2-like isoform X2 [Frankliniella occidentalis]XP_052122970.1 protein O-mannosyl-transferase TMTC2-like isoform X3 [Frankliniella occidentalis]XP_052122971.1 protein O-mannosyl-transferase TMTC2-like isoform X4 [Frankliniella occidentalis]XP_052122972.1 protein O-mannosyl-transferase TMTC2-like isoform X5 [Frankliniella occidentalis]
MDGTSLAVAALAFVLYVNTLGAGFVYDDSRAVVRNPDVRGGQSAWLAFGHDFWGTPLGSAGSHGSYRPLAVLSLRANAYLAGGLRPRAFHLVNAQLHALCSWLVARLSRRLGPPAAWPAAALLFAVHPVHCEAVAGIVGRADLLAAALALLALLAFLRHLDWRERGCRCPAPGPAWCRCRAWAGALLAATLALAAGAMLCKEPGLTVLVVCASYDLALQLGRRQRKPFSLGSLGALAAGGAGLLAARLWLVGLRTPVFARADNPAAHASSWGTRALTFLHLPAVNLRLLLWPGTLSFDWSMDAVERVESLADPRNLQSAALYASLAVLVAKAVSALRAEHQGTERYTARRARTVPKRRQVKPDRKMKICGVCSKLIESRGSSYVYTYNNNVILTNNNNNNNNNNYISSRSSSSSSSGSGGSATERGGEPDVPPPVVPAPAGAALLGLALLVFPLLPASNLFFYVGFVIAERVLYLPSVGFCLLVAQGFAWLADGNRGRRAAGAGAAVGASRRPKAGGGRREAWPGRAPVLVAGVLLLTVFAARTVQRNWDWADEEDLYRAGIAVNPPKAYGNLGSVLSSRGRLSEAEHAFRMALKFRPNMAEVHYNLGNLLLKRDKLEEAIRSYQQAIHYRPSLALAHLHLGHAFAARGQVREAVSALVRCASLRLPSSGRLLQQAVHAVRDEATHEAARVSALLLLGHLHAAQGRLRAAEAAVREAILARPEDYQPEPLYKLLAEVEEKLRVQAEARSRTADPLDHREQAAAHAEDAVKDQPAPPAQEEQQRTAWSWRTRTCNDSNTGHALPGRQQSSGAERAELRLGPAREPPGPPPGPGPEADRGECPMAAAALFPVPASPCA